MVRYRMKFGWKGQIVISICFGSLAINKSIFKQNEDICYSFEITYHSFYPHIRFLVWISNSPCTSHLLPHDYFLDNKTPFNHWHSATVLFSKFVYIADFLLIKASISSKSCLSFAISILASLNSNDRTWSFPHPLLRPHHSQFL